jgi:hypothetical protein
MAFVGTSFAADTTPNQFTFLDRLYVEPTPSLVSGPVTILGIAAPAPVSVVGGSYSVGCTGTFTTSPGTVTNGQSICVSLTPSPQQGAAVDAQLTVGGISDYFSAITDPDTQLPSLLPFANGFGRLKVLDWSHPRAASNPLVLDIADSATELRTAKTALGAVMAGMSSTITNIGASVMAYVRDGKLYFFFLNASEGTTKVTQLTTYGDVCAVQQAIGSYYLSARAWFLFSRAGADGICGTVDDVYVFDSNQSGTAPGTAGVLNVDPIYKPTTTGNPGIVDGFLTMESSPQVALTHRDNNFATPVALVNLASSDSERLEQTLRNYFIKVTPLGQTAPQLFRYDETQDVDLVRLHGESHPFLSGPLYTFVNSTGSDGGVANGTYDGSNVFFADGNSLLRMPLNETLTGQVQQVATASQTITRIQVPTYSQDLLIFTAYDSSGNGGVYSVSKTATNAIPTLLQASDSVTAATLVAVSPGVVWINLTRKSDGITTALRINADGTGTTTTANAYWAGYTAPTTVDVGNAQFDEAHGLNPQSMLLAVVGSGYVSLRAVDPATGSTVATMGRINNVAAGTQVSGHGFGRYAGITATISRGAASDTDVFYLDTQTAYSLKGAGNVTGKDDFFLGGN